jgi:hypothetical protein
MAPVPTNNTAAISPTSPLVGPPVAGSVAPYWAYCAYCAAAAVALAVAVAVCAAATDANSSTPTTHNEVNNNNLRINTSFYGSVSHVALKVTLCLTEVNTNQCNFNDAAVREH